MALCRRPCRARCTSTTRPGSPNGRPRCSASGSASVGSTISDWGRLARGRRRRGGGVDAGHQRRGPDDCTAPTTCAGIAARRSCRSSSESTAPVACAASALRCPYHSWTYGLDGHLMRAPHTDLDDHDVDDFRLNPVGRRDLGRVRVRAPDTRAGHPAVRGREQGGDTLANYGLGRAGHRRDMTYQVAANYKVLLENYNECYHCGPVHPELCRLVPAFAGGGTDLAWEDGVPHREGAWTFTMTGTTTRSPLPGLSEDGTRAPQGRPRLPEPDDVRFGRPRRVVPPAATFLRPDRRGLLAALRRRRGVGSGQFDPADAGELWDLVNRQDWAVCESVQRGMSSRSYRHGWFAPMEDDSLDIRRWLLPLLEDRA